MSGRLSGLRRALDQGADLLKAKDNARALAVCSKALKAFGPSAPLLSNYGLALHGVGRYQEAIVAYNRALMFQSSPIAYNNRASTLMKLRRYDEALQDANVALSIDYTMAPAWGNRGVLLQHKNDLDGAIDAYRKAILHQPADADSYLNKAFCHLLREEFAWGWDDYDWRWFTEGYASPEFHAQASNDKRWRGESLSGKTIFVWREQGLGDTVMFSRYLRLLTEMGAHVIFWCQSEARPLFEHSPGLEWLGVELWNPDAQEAKTPEHDYHAPLGDLPKLCGTLSVETIPPVVPINVTDTAQAYWRGRLNLKDGQRNIGVSWSGNPDHKNDHNRSIPLAMFAELTRSHPDARFFSLQRDVNACDQAALEGSGIAFIGRDGIGSLGECAAIIANMDMVVTVDTVFAHLAGAMGKPTLVLLPFHPDWRWLMGRKDSPWYPSVQLLRQSVRGDWLDVIVRAANLI